MKKKMVTGKAVAPKVQLKIVGPDTPLPYVFDLLWDAKTGKDLDTLKEKDWNKAFHLLAQNGFDAILWLKGIKK